MTAPAQPSSGPRRERLTAWAISYLCLCILFQMLGVPVTLLAPGSSVDTVSASILEGFTVPPSAIDLPFSHHAGTRREPEVSLHLPTLCFTLFHPPQT